MIVIGGRTGGAGGGHLPPNLTVEGALPSVHSYNQRWWKMFKGGGGMLPKAVVEW